MMNLLVALVDDATIARVAPHFESGVDFIAWKPGDPAPQREIDLLVLAYMVSHAALASVGGQVKHVQSQSLGYDGVAGIVPDGVTYSNAVGVHEAPTAEMAMTLVLASQRGWPQVGRDQVTETWARTAWPGLLGKRVLLIGVGGIGGEFEKRIDGFGVQLTKIARTARDGIHATSELPTLLPNADIVVIAVPLSAETTHLVDGAFLDLLPHGALVVNVSRGPIVDTDALVARVRTGAVRSALDVFDPEPLPVGHPLWSLPVSLVSPHMGGNVATMNDRMDALAVSQISRLLRGEAPEHIVINEGSQ
jgi:phosphoglycerate dehydrogenase-like enzyme